MKINKEANKKMNYFEYMLQTVGKGKKLEWQPFQDELADYGVKGPGFIANGEYHIKDSPTRVFAKLKADDTTLVELMGHVWTPVSEKDSGRLGYAFTPEGDILAEFTGFEVILQGIQVNSGTTGSLYMAAKDLAKEHPSLKGSLEKIMEKLNKAHKKFVQEHYQKMSEEQ